MSSHAVNAFGSDVSAFCKSAGSSCTIPLEIFFPDIHKLSFRTLQQRKDLLLSKGCWSFGHGEVLTLRLTRAFDYPSRSYNVQPRKLVHGAATALDHSRVTAAAQSERMSLRRVVARVEIGYKLACVPFITFLHLFFSCDAGGTKWLNVARLVSIR